MSVMILVTRVCAEVAGISDPAAAERAQQILARVLEQQDLFVVDRDCTETYRAVHLVEGGRLHVGLFGPSGRQASSLVTADQEPGDVYAELYHRLRTTVPVEPAVATDPAAMSSTTTPIQPYEPVDHPPQEDAATPVPAMRSQFYVRLGMGVEGATGGGGAFGLGWRLRGAGYGLDLSLDSVSSLVSGKVEVLAFREKAYFGGGLSAGSAGSIDPSSGIAAEGTAGVMLSKSVFAQGDLTVPFFSSQEGYPIAVAFSLGLAIGGH